MYYIKQLVRIILRILKLIQLCRWKMIQLNSCVVLVRSIEKWQPERILTKKKKRRRLHFAKMTASKDAHAKNVAHQHAYLMSVHTFFHHKTHLKKFEASSSSYVTATQDLRAWNELNKEKSCVECPVRVK